jgi:DNA oxidative demethylase
MRLMAGLFDEESQDVPLAPGAAVLGGFARPFEEAIAAALSSIVARAPFRHMVTPGGRRMSVAMTNCGLVGWVSDHHGYRYDARDPDSDQSWPQMPDVFQELATKAAARAGFSDFTPDACLINRYEPGARLSLHQDKDERQFDAPIVSVSLGLPAVFLFGGMRRADPTRRVRLAHGDVVVFGGSSRLCYHGVLALEEGQHPTFGGYRINLTFRRAL